MTEALKGQFLHGSAHASLVGLGDQAKKPIWSIK